jgi:hypothetical protein
MIKHYRDDAQRIVKRTPRVRGEFGVAKVFIARAFRFNAGLDWPGPYRAAWTMEIVCPRAGRGKGESRPDRRLSAYRDGTAQGNRPGCGAARLESTPVSPRWACAGSGAAGLRHAHGGSSMLRARITVGRGRAGSVRRAPAGPDTAGSGWPRARAGSARDKLATRSAPAARPGLDCAGRGRR